MKNLSLVFLSILLLSCGSYDDLKTGKKALLYVEDGTIEEFNKEYGIEIQKELKIENFQDFKVLHFYTDHGIVCIDPTDIDNISAHYDPEVRLKKSGWPDSKFYGGFPYGSPVLIVGTNGRSFGFYNVNNNPKPISIKYADCEALTKQESFEPKQIVVSLN